MIGNALHLTAGFVELRRPVIVDPALEGFHDGGLVVVPDRNDEREAMLFDIGVVKAGKCLPLFIRQKVQAGCVMAWAARLGSFLAYRVFAVGKDRRFDQIKINPIKYFVAWTLQGACDSILHASTL